MTIPFKPAPDDTLVLFGNELAFRQHPSARIRMPNSAEGGRATVYELRDGGGKRLALKVFRPRFREPTLAQSGARLTRLRTLEGMDAARRDVLLPGDDAVRRFPDLEYALLMPWIEGETWTEVMMRAALRGEALPVPTAIHLCDRFLAVVRALEAAGASHTDIAGSNVVVQQGPIAVQLLDLEDMYLPGAPLPANPRPGTPGYQHRLREPVFCLEGDRYAAAVLAAEMLAISNPALTEMGGDTGVFVTHVGHETGDEAYGRVEPWLRQTAPAFAAAFARAWHAPRLADCPTVAELHEAIHPLAAATPLPAATPVPPKPFQAPAHPNVGWSRPGAEAPSAPPPPRMPPGSSPPPSLGTVSWDPDGAPPTAPAPVAPRPSGGGDIPMWLILALAAIFVALLIAVASASGS